MPDVCLIVNGRNVTLPAGSMVAAAVARAGGTVWRRSVRGEPRAPLCGMGICYECRVSIDGDPQRLSCQIVCRDGMRVVTE